MEISNLFYKLQTKCRAVAIVELEKQNRVYKKASEAVSSFCCYFYNGKRNMFTLIFYLCQLLFKGKQKTFETGKGCIIIFAVKCAVGCNNLLKYSSDNKK